MPQPPQITERRILLDQWPMPVAPTAASIQTLTPTSPNLPSFGDVLQSDILSTFLILTAG